jgi:hypothetical protein
MFPGSLGDVESVCGASNIIFSGDQKGQSFSKVGNRRKEIAPDQYLHTRGRMGPRGFLKEVGGDQAMACAQGSSRLSFKHTYRPRRYEFRSASLIRSQRIVFLAETPTVGNRRMARRTAERVLEHARGGGAPGRRGGTRAERDAWWWCGRRSGRVSAWKELVWLASFFSSLSVGPVRNGEARCARMLRAKHRPWQGFLSVSRHEGAGWPATREERETAGGRDGERVGRQQTLRATWQELGVSAPVAPGLSRRHRDSQKERSPRPEQCRHRRRAVGRFALKCRRSILPSPGDRRLHG